MSPAGLGELSAGRLWLLVQRLVPRAVREFFADGCPHLAGSIAFRVLLSLFPVAIVVAALFGVVSRAVGFEPDVIDSVVRQAPLTDEGTEQLRELLEQSAGNLGTIGLVGGVGLVWAASGMMSAVRTALNLAWDVEDRRPWLVGKIVDVVFVFAASLVVATSVALNLTVRLAQELVAGLPLAGAVAQPLLGVVAPFVLTFLVVVVAYRVVPATTPPLRDLVGPALVVAAVFTLAQVLFALYLEHFGRYNAIYGSLGAVVAFMFFVYLAALVFLFGAELAAEAPSVRDEIERGAEPESGPPLGHQLKQALKGLVVRSR